MFINTIYIPQQDPRSGYVSSIESESPAFASINVPTSSLVDVPLTEVRFAGRVFELNAPMHVSLWIDLRDGEWTCEKRDLSILAFGRTAAEAVHSFSEDFEMTWDVIAQADDDSLTVEAQQVKDAMLALVKRVTKR